MSGNEEKNVEISNRILSSETYQNILNHSSSSLRTNRDIEKNSMSDNQYRFKHGMEYNQNLDEDGIMYGFDIIINQINSPFFNDLTEFFQYGLNNQIKPIIERQSIYEEFKSELKKYFRTIGDSANSSSPNQLKNFKSHYIQSISGLNELIWKSDKKFTEYFKDKITIDLTEDTYLNTGYLAALYKNLVYDKANGRMIIPDNLLKFDMSIVVSEIRNFQKFLKLYNTSDLDDGRKALQSYTDNVSRYVYQLYDCTFSFDSMSHKDDISNSEAPEFFKNFQIDIYYKYSDMEMEKFKFTNNYEPDTKYSINNQRMQPGKDRIIVSERLITSDSVRNQNNKEERLGQFNSIDPYEVYFKQKDNSPNRILDYGSESAIVSSIREEKNSSDPLNDLKNGAKIAEKEKKRSVVGEIARKTKDYAKQRIIKKRDQLVNDTIRAIRRASGLRRISSPINVYEDDNILNFARNQVRDFANQNLNQFLRGTSSNQ